MRCSDHRPRRQDQSTFHKLEYDKTRGLLLDKEPIKQGHTVFSVRSVPKKADFGEIPELKERYDAFLEGLKSGNVKSAQDALAALGLR